MAANVDNQFRSLGCPVGWILHAAAMTASPVWERDTPLRGDDRKLAEALLEIRFRFYDRMADDLLQLMVASMSLINRRPRRGMDPRQLLAILHSMIDGAVLRRFIQPDVFDSRMIGEAVYALALAFPEDGTLSDPRRPATGEGSALFDAMLERAGAAWLSAAVRSSARRRPARWAGRTVRGGRGTGPTWRWCSGSSAGCARWPTACRAPSRSSAPSTRWSAQVCASSSSGRSPR